MTVRTLHQILEARNGVLVYSQGTLVPTVVQGREHAPPTPSFNQRANSAAFAFGLADAACAQGLITPHQRYEHAMERDIG